MSITKATLYDQFETSKEAEAGEGIRIEMPASGAKFWLKRAGGANVPFTKYVERENRKFRAAGKNLNNEQGEEIIRVALVHHCLIKWEGVTGRDGKNLKFTPENAIKLFEDLPDLMMAVYGQAADADNFLASHNIMEEEVKN
jgi:hypothetical protein